MDGCGRRAKQSETAAEKVRNVSPIKINEFQIASGAPANATNSFIELYNSGTAAVDISNWTLTEHAIQQAIFSTVKIPAGTRLAAGGFYVLGLSNSGLAAAARKGETTLHVRSTTGMTVGDSIVIDTGSSSETRTIAGIGTPAANSTTLWQPLPDGPVMTIPAGSTNVPVTSVAGFVVGEKIALGYGATYPSVARTIEKIEVATVTAIGKPGTQGRLAAAAPAGSSNLKVGNVDNISVGDKIRLDIASVGHGIETVTVTRGRHGWRERDGPHDRGDVEVRPRVQHAVQRSRDRNQFLARDDVSALEQRARPGARLRHHARSSVDERSRDRRGGARRARHDCGLSGFVGTRISGSAALRFRRTPAASCSATPADSSSTA